MSSLVKQIRHQAFPDDATRLFAFSHLVDVEAGEQLSGWALYQVSTNAHAETPTRSRLEGGCAGTHLTPPPARPARAARALVGAAAAA